MKLLTGLPKTETVTSAKVAAHCASQHVVLFFETKNSLLSMFSHKDLRCNFQCMRNNDHFCQSAKKKTLQKSVF